MRVAPERYWPVKDAAVAAMWLGLSLRDEIATGVARAGTKVNHEIGATNGVFVMLDDQHGIAQDCAAAQESQAGGRCRARANRWMAHREHRARRANENQFVWPDGCAGLRRRKALRRNDRD